MQIVDHNTETSVGLINGVKAEFPPHLVTLKSVQWAQPHVKHRCGGKGHAAAAAAGVHAAAAAAVSAAAAAAVPGCCRCCCHRVLCCVPECCCASDPQLLTTALRRCRFLLGEGPDALYVAFMGTKLPRDMATNVNAFQVGAGL